MTEPRQRDWAARTIVRVTVVGLVALLASCSEAAGPEPEQVDRPGDIVFSPAAVRAHVAVLAEVETFDLLFLAYAQPDGGSDHRPTNQGRNKHECCNRYDTDELR